MAGIAANNLGQYPIFNGILHPISARHEQSIEHALFVLTGKYSHVVKEIYLYGSCARSEEKYRSDVDILVKVTPDAERNLLRQMKVDVMPDDYRLPEVDLKISCGDTFSNSVQFNKNIMRDGKLLWKKD